MIFLDLLRYWRRPTVPSHREPITLRVGLALFLLLLVSIAARMGMLELLEPFKEDQGVFTTDDTPTQRLNPLQFIFFGMLLMPVLEELLFRGSLWRPWACLAAAAALVGYFLYHGITQPTGIDFRAWAIITGGCMLLAANLYREGKLPQADRLYHRAFPVWFYLSALLFGIVHLSNFHWGEAPWYWLPLHMSPHILSAMVYGFTAMRYGLIASIAMHILNNALGYAFFLLGY